MPDYTYKAINPGGSNITGKIKADSVEMAESMLSAQGYIPSGIKEEGAGFLAGWLQRIETKLTPVKPEELVLFTKQFRTMISAGVPMLQLLGVLENQTENKKLRDAIASLSLDIREGFGPFMTLL